MKQVKNILSTVSFTTKIHYMGFDKTWCIRTTKQFSSNSLYENVHEWFVQWRKHCDFNIEILDTDDEFVDFDQAYYNENGFTPLKKQKQNNGAESTTSTPLTLVLRLKERHQDQTQDPSENHFQQKPNATSLNNIHQFQELSNSNAKPPDDEHENLSSPSDTSYLQSYNGNRKIDKNKTIELKTDVNSFQRDQYKSDETIIMSGEKQRQLVRIQGDKTKLSGDGLKASVKPRLKIKTNILGIERRQKISEQLLRSWYLVIFLLVEECQNGKRKLFYSAWRDFITDHSSEKNQLHRSVNDVTQKEGQNQSCFPNGYKPEKQKYTKIPLNTQMFESGFDLDLKTQAIVQARTHPPEMKEFCTLTDEYPGDTNYTTNRLAFLLENEDIPMWNTLTLSNAMAFAKDRTKIKYENVIVNTKITERIPTRKMKRKEDFIHSKKPVKRLQKVKQHVKKQQTQEINIPFVVQNNLSTSTEQRLNHSSISSVNQQENNLSHTIRSYQSDIPIQSNDLCQQHNVQQLTAQSHALQQSTYTGVAHQTFIQAGYTVWHSSSSTNSEITTYTVPLVNPSNSQMVHDKNSFNEVHHKPTSQINSHLKDGNASNTIISPNIFSPAQMDLDSGFDDSSNNNIIENTPTIYPGQNLNLTEFDLTDIDLSDWPTNKGK